MNMEKCSWDEVNPFRENESATAALMTVRPGEKLLMLLMLLFGYGANLKLTCN